MASSQPSDDTATTYTNMQFRFAIPSVENPSPGIKYGSFKNVIMTCFNIGSYTDAVLFSVLIFICGNFNIDVMMFVYAAIIIFIGNPACIIIVIMERVYFATNDMKQHIIVILSLYQCILTFFSNGFGWINLTPQQMPKLQQLQTTIEGSRYLYVICIEGSIIGLVGKYVGYLFEFEIYEITSFVGSCVIIFEFLYFSTIVYIYGDLSPFHNVSWTLLIVHWIAVMPGPLLFVLVAFIISSVEWLWLFDLFVYSPVGLLIFSQSLELEVGQ